MKINLIRNLNTERNKEQEDSFKDTMNLALYFDINNQLTKIDGWKLSNIKRLVSKINESEKDIDIEFSKWNENVQYIHSNLKVNLIQFNNIDENITISLRNRDIKSIHNYLEQIKEDKNLKLEFMFAIADILKTDQAVAIINEFINNGISTIDVAIDLLLPLLLMECDHNE